MLLNNKIRKPIIHGIKYALQNNDDRNMFNE